MDDERFDTLTRQLETPRARRSTVSRGLAALFALGLAMRQSGVEAKKHKRREKKRKKKAKPPTCAESCHEACPTCHNTIEGPPICGFYAGADCSIPCSSHSDCVGTDFPYCVTSVTNRETGQTEPHDCPGSGVARCTEIRPCVCC